MRPSHLSYTFLATFLTSIFCLQWWQLTDYPASVWIILGCLGVFGFLGSVIPAGRRPALMVITVVMGITLALLSVSRTTHTPTPDTVDFHADGKTAAVRGIIADDADRRVEVTNYTVEAEIVKTPTVIRKVSGRILVSVRVGGPRFEYGDPVIIRGKLQHPAVMEGFRYDNYLSRIEVYSVMKDAIITRAGPNAGNLFLLYLYRLRRAIEDQINILLPEPHASLLAGLLLGSKRGIPAALLEDFNATGLTHVVAISGYNITMLVTVIGTLLFWLPLRWRFLPSVGLIIAFTLLTGATASAVRAAVMGILSLVAIQTGRISSTRLSVLWSAFCMLAWNPKLLWYDAGFHLSFLALIGVLELSPLLKPFFAWLPEKFGIRDSLCLTVSAQMLASAWIAYLFGELSLIAPVSNLLVPPSVPYAMLFGTLALLLSLISLPLGRVAAAVGWIPLAWITGATHTMGQIPFASVSIGKFSTVWITIYYAVVTGCVIWRNLVTTHTASASASSSSSVR